jgi:hypothetical protein
VIVSRHCQLIALSLIVSACASQPGQDEAAPTAAEAAPKAAESAPTAAESAPTAAEAAPTAAESAPKAAATDTKAPEARSKPIAPPPVEKGGPADVNEHGVSLAACQTICAHVLALSLGALPEDAPAQVREEHAAQLALGCPAGCMREATPVSNSCVLRATTVQQAAACQP